MLNFTQGQRAAIIANRNAHNLLHTNMAQLQGSTMLMGNASPIPRDAWGEWDREGVTLQRDVLAVFNSIAASSQVAMPIGKIVHHFQTVSDSGEVNVSMDGRSKAKTDQQVVNYHGTPLPILDSSFSYGWRQVATAATEGVALDPAGRANSMRKVAEQLEMATLDGYTGIKVGTVQSYGLRTHPKRNTRTTGQALNGATGAQWLADIIATIKLLHGDNFRVPATLYLNWDDWFYASSTDFDATSNTKTILQRIQEVAGVGEIVPASNVLASEIIAVVKRPEVVRILNGMPMVSRAMFRANPEDDYDFSVMAAAAIEIRFDDDDNCGIAHSSI